MNIMDMVKKAVSDHAMGQIGGMLGMSDTKKTKSTFDTAIGSILGGMMNKSTSQEGAKQVYDMTSKADPGIMDKLGDLLGGGGGKQLEQVQKTGGGMLDGIFGGNQRTSMIDSISKALGLDNSIIGKLLTLAAPMLLGVIAKHVKSAGMDAMGLSGLLGDQKPHVNAALPAGLGQQLGFGNLLASSGAPASSVSNTPRSTPAPTTTATHSKTSDAPKKGPGLLPILLPLIILGAIAWFAWPSIQKMMNGGGGGGETVVENKNEFATMDVSALGDAGPKLQKGFTEITSGFTGLADKGAEGAETLKTRITDFSKSIGDMGLADMSADAKPVAKSMIGKFIETVEKMLGKQSDVIKGVLKGPVDALIEKLKPFA